MKRIWKLCPLLLLFFLGFGVVEVQAVYDGIKGVTMSPDGNAFTTNAGEKDYIWYDKGMKVYTGNKSKVREPQEGEHIYETAPTDSVAVGRWEVAVSNGMCIHNGYPAGNQYCGVSFGREKCYGYYYSGWYPYCADCGELIVDALFYMHKDVAKELAYLDLTKGYYYKCPHCDNLEQGISMGTHICKSISPNRYFVRYHANYGSGYMGRSIHMVNNAVTYEGREVTPQTTLNLNSYSRKGYEFVGWNTKRDGSGKSFADGAEIYNLSTEENATVILYAQWKKSSSVLEIDPAGGTYEGKKQIFSRAGEYGASYQLDMSSLYAPKGYTVSFDTAGGKAIDSVTGTRSFLEWSCKEPFHGKLEEGQYHYLGADGSVDRIQAIYTLDAIILPKAVKEGYTFGGWFADEACTQPVGMPGSQYIPKEETTLFAAWVDLQLLSVDNYTANQGKGAVNLSWSQKDNQAKVYQIYQKTKTSDWIQISEAEEKANNYIVSDSIGFSGKSGEYTVPYTGFYTLTLTGAQGADYGSYEGGKGGQVQGTVYLEKGDKLQYTIGGKNGFSGGGAGSVYGNGGGYSSVTSQKEGLLLVAGGGGGATNMGPGGAGGSEAHVTGSWNGESSEAGGGGGYKGGAAGAVETHTHVASCEHIHVGDRTTYGGCYTILVTCDNAEFERVEIGRTFYYGNVDNDGNHVYCVRCGSYECPGHRDIKWGYECTQCQERYETSVAKCTAMKAYALGCGVQDTYICGMEDGEIIKLTPAYGGSNYINTGSCLHYTEASNVQRGNGSLLIESQQVGLIDANYLNGVTATDLAKPEAIAVESIQKTAVGEEEIRISFARPKDNGTEYYHKAESYSKESNTLICTSNQTVNTLTSGIEGYRYVVNGSATTVVNETHEFYKEKGEGPFLVIKSQDTEQYLHIAPQDKAGNIGPTIHILIWNQDVIYWPLMTEKLEIEQGSNVHPAVQPDTYYVRADDSTPFRLMLEGLLCGTPRVDYQINQATFAVSHSGESGSLSVEATNREAVEAGTYTYPGQLLQKKTTGNMGLQDASYTVVKRYDTCKSLSVTQSFTVSATLDGQRLQVTPHVAAITEKEVFSSDEAADIQNSIYLVADGKGPNIEGMELLQNLEVIEYSEGNTLEIELQAKDEGSGLGKFYVEIRNRDNGGLVRIEDTEGAGKLRFVISDEEMVFNGAFEIAVYAADNVGNETIQSNDLLGVGLQAYVERVLEPHTPQFKKGESGVLYVETIGYVERLEISFPAGFEEANRSIVYEVPNYYKSEEIPFVVPFEVPEGEMVIQVKAFKAGTELEAAPELITISVKGSILDELRTRLR
ncbi:MAG: InlB B-repeat-containing protein [Lachnospiraceae bacterium]|nr:InlB B-repeat-containing protein [Lachnospiraceae bacterium]